MRNKIRKAGFTLVELMIVLVGVTGLAVMVAVAWIILHFVRKYW